MKQISHYESILDQNGSYSVQTKRGTPSRIEAQAMDRLKLCGDAWRVTCFDWVMIVYAFFAAEPTVLVEVSYERYVFKY